ncbi:MAG TPA: septum formation initiator family protein [Terriglobales bacterium]|nr:septum formation initiator family protein [Terriglobales bacterium]
MRRWPNLKQSLKPALRRLTHGLRLAAVALPVLWLVQHAVLGPSGYLALRHKQLQVQQEMARIQALEAQNRQLNQSVKALTSDPAAIEGIARQQLHLTRPGEVVYTYPVAPAPNGAAAASILH